MNRDEDVVLAGRMRGWSSATAIASWRGWWISAKRRRRSSVRDVAHWPGPSVPSLTPDDAVLRLERAIAVDHQATVALQDERVHPDARTGPTRKAFGADVIGDVAGLHSAGALPRSPSAFGYRPAGMLAGQEDPRCASRVDPARRDRDRRLQQSRRVAIGEPAT